MICLSFALKRRSITISIDAQISSRIEFKKISVANHRFIRMNCNIWALIKMTSNCIHVCNPYRSCILNVNHSIRMPFPKREHQLNNFCHCALHLACLHFIVMLYRFYACSEYIDMKSMRIENIHTKLLPVYVTQNTFSEQMARCLIRFGVIVDNRCIHFP